MTESQLMEFPEDDDRILELAHIIKKKITMYNLGETNLVRDILKYDFVPKCICGSNIINKYSKRCYVCWKKYRDVKKELKNNDTMLNLVLFSFSIIWVCGITMGVLLELQLQVIFASLSLLSIPIMFALIFVIIEYALLDSLKKNN